MLVDSHAHLDDPAFSPDLGLVLARAQAGGVAVMVAIGCGLESCRAALELAGRYPQVYAALGFHPHDARNLGAGDLEELARLARHPKVVALGEMGLDFYRNLSPRESQVEAFRAQLELASRLGLPVIVHSRQAQEETWAILREWAVKRQESRPLGVMHCFSGDLALARRYLELGLLISLAGPVTYDNARRAAEVARGFPLEGLLVETDCPYLAPAPYRGRRNEPGYLVATVERIAQIRGCPPEEVARATAENALRLFSISLEGVGQNLPGKESIAPSFPL